MKKIGRYLVQVLKDFVQGFIDNPSKFAVVLIALPGLLIGFFLTNHYNAIIKLDEKFSASGFQLFALVVLGCINIFNAVSYKGKRNTQSACIAAGTSLLLTILSVLYIRNYFNHAALFPEYSMDSNTWFSIWTVGISAFLADLGSVLSFIFRNRNYKKEV